MRQQQQLPPRAASCLDEARRIRYSYPHDLMAFAWPYRIVDGQASTLIEAARAIQRERVVFRRGSDDRSQARYEMARPPFAASHLGSDCDGWNLAILGSIANLHHIGCAALFWPSARNARHATLLVGDFSVDLTARSERVVQRLSAYSRQPSVARIWLPTPGDLTNATVFSEIR